MAKLSVEEVSKIAFIELQRRSREWDCELFFSGLIDAGDFFVFGYRFKDIKNIWKATRPSNIVVDAETGKILPKPKPLPGTEFSNQIKAGKKLEIPEKYLL